MKVKKARDVVEKILLEKRGKTHFIKNFLSGNSVDDNDNGDDINNNCNNDDDGDGDGDDDDDDNNDDDDDDDDDNNGRANNKIIALIRLDFKRQN